jgi:hypothetical protein
LRQLDHLTSLSLNYDMIYGATDPEELDIDHYTAHSDKPGVSHSTIGRTVPKGITTLLIGPQEYTNDGNGRRCAYSSMERMASR